MGNPKTDGRMIRKKISDSHGFAKLCPEAAVLHCMIIPHLNSHGKLNGSPGFIKDEICPRIPYLNYKNIPILLKEISENTKMKWFINDERYWIHSINFLSEHQKLNADKLGRDLLPTYSGLTPELVTLEVEEEVEEKAKASPELPPPVDNSPEESDPSEEKRAAIFKDDEQKDFKNFIKKFLNSIQSFNFKNSFKRIKINTHRQS